MHITEQFRYAEYTGIANRMIDRFGPSVIFLPYLPYVEPPQSEAGVVSI